MSDAARKGSSLLLVAMASFQVASLAIRASRRGSEDLPLLVGLAAFSLLAAGFCSLLPTHLVAPFQQLVRPTSAPARGSAKPGFLLLAAAILFGSALTQQFYWDERAITLAASGIAQDGLAGLVSQYRDNAWLGPQHPPLVPAVYAGVAWLNNDSWLALRLWDSAFAVASLVLADRLLTATIGRERSVPALFLLLASPLFLRLGSAVTSDVPALFFLLATLLSAQRLIEKPSDLRAIRVGACLGLALLCRYTNALVLLPLLAMPTLLQPLARPVRHIGIVAVTTALVCLPWLGFAWQHGLVSGQLEKMARFAGNATSSGVFWRGILEMLGSRIPSALGVYLLPLLAAAAARAWPLTRTNAFWFAWAFGVVAVVAGTAPLSRYALPAFPAFAAIATLGLPQEETARARVLLLALLLAGATLAYSASVDLTLPMELLPGTTIPLG